MSREQTDLTASNSSVASSALVESDVLEVYKYSDSPNSKQVDLENRPNPEDYAFEISNSHQTNSRQAFLDLIKNYNVETHFGPSSIRDGKPCLIKAFEKLSFVEYERILEALRSNSVEENSLYQAIKDLNPKTFKNFTLNPTEVQQIVGIKSLSDLVSKIQQKRSVTLTQLLGSKDNLEIFKKALKEEVQSPAFLKALWEHSLKPHYGVKDPNTFAIQIMSGASGSGKSFAGDQAVNRQYPVEGTPDPKKPTFWMAWVDGGIARDINVTQQYVKLLSLELGVEVDLYKDSKKILEPTKGKVKQAIITSAKAAEAQNKPLNIGIVEPLTYSSDIALGDVQTEIKSVQELAEFLSTNSKKIDLSYDYVSGNDFEGHAEVVKTQGENRAFPTTDQAKSDFETMNSTTPSVPVGEAAAVENPPSRLQRFKALIPSIRFAENKKYGPGGYQFGVNGSVNGFIEYEKAFGDGQFGVTLSRHINCNDLRVYINQNEEWELFDEAKHKGLERHVFSERLVNDWKALKDSPKAALITYASDNRSDRKYSNFMTNFNPKDLKFGLSSEVDKIFQSNLKKKGRIVKDENNLGYLVPFVKILDELHKHEQKEGDLKVYAYDDPKKIQQAIKNLSQLIAEKRKENLGKSYNPFASSSTLPLMEKTLQKLIKREALLTRKEILILKKDLVELEAKKQEKEEAGVQLTLSSQIAELIAQLFPLVDEINSLELNLDGTRATVAYEKTKIQKKLEPKINPLKQQLENIEKQLANPPDSLEIKPGFFQDFFGTKWTIKELNDKKSDIKNRLTPLQAQLDAPAKILASIETELAAKQNELSQLQLKIKQSKEWLQLTTDIDVKQKRLDTFSLLGEVEYFLPAPSNLRDAILDHIHQLASRKESVAEDDSETDEVKSISSSAETLPETVSETGSERASGRTRVSLKDQLINPKGSSEIHYPFSQKLYDLSLARLEGDDHKNAEYLIALNQIIASINPNDSKSIEEGIALLTELEKIKFENKKGLSSWRSNTSQLIDEVKSFFETRLEVVQTIKSDDLLTSEDLESKIKQINAELDEQKTPDPVKHQFLAWAEKLIESFIGWLATKKGMSFQEYNASLKLVQESLTLGALLYCAIITLLTTPSSRVNTPAQQFTRKDENSPNDTVPSGPSAGG